MEHNRDLILRLRLGDRAITIGGASSPYRLLASGVSGAESAETVTETMEHAQLDGALVLSRHLSGRDLTLQFEIADYDNREAYRRELLSFFDPTAAGVLTVTRLDGSGGSVTRSCACMLSGRMTMMQEHLYSYVRVKVPLYCPDPFFYAEAEEVSAAREVFPLWSFPLTVTEAAGVTGGLIRLQDTMTVNNAGDAPAGCLITLRACDHGGNAGIVNPKITRLEDGAYIRILTTLADGDTLTVSTVPGAKYVLKNGEYDLRFDRGSTFFPLLRGVNTFRISADAMLEVPDTVIAFRCRYFGV